MAIVSDAKDRFPASTDFGKILRRKLKFITLGCISPDVPYLSHLDLFGKKWADVMHYHQTNGIIQNGMHSLHVTKGKDEYWDHKLAWLVGFASHLVADATIHPIVEAIVGPCTDSDSMSEHTECEMTQDVLVFHDVKNQELHAAEYTNHLRACKRDGAYGKVMEFWSEHAKVNAPALGAPDTEGMLNRYLEQIDTAEGGSTLAGAFRHIGFDYVYKTSTDLLNNKKAKVKKYYSEVALPTGGKGHFRTEGFDRAVQNTVAVWSRMERFLFTNDNIAEILPNWNLDTGFDQVRNIRTYWV